jgi:hypothetical protein
MIDSCKENAKHGGYYLISERSENYDDQMIQNYINK